MKLAGPQKNNLKNKNPEIVSAEFVLICTIQNRNISVIPLRESA